ncbi:hypothetical protein DSECCO2_367510 [anaerobic digester metagenome]
MEENKDNINVNETEPQETEVKTYTQEEVMALLQAEADKRVTQALKKQQKDYEKKLSLSGLDEQQRKQAEKDMEIQELKDKLREFNVMQTKTEITKVLSARGLDARFADLIEIGDDVEEAQARIDSLDKLFKAAVAKEVQSRIGSNTPKASTIGLEVGMTKEKFSQLNDNEKIAFLKSNPDFLK